MYSERIVVFIDLLGFSEYVCAENTTAEMVSGVLNIFQSQTLGLDEFSSEQLAWAHIGEETYEGGELINSQENKLNITFFSDCVVWTYDLKKVKIEFGHFLEIVLSTFTILQLILYKNNIVPRGGIAIGNFYQGDNKLYGSGLVKAAKLEKNANYPRIAVEKEIIDRVENNFRPLVMKFITYEKKSNFYYVDLIKYIESLNKRALSGNKESEIVKKYLPDYVASIVNIINTGVNHPDEKVKKKYLWLKKGLESVANLQAPVNFK